MILTLSADPEAGALMPGLGGVRKLRFAPEGRGKSGAFRVICCLLDDNTPIPALRLHGKNEQANPTPEQRRRLLQVVETSKAKARGRRCVLLAERGCPFAEV